MAVTMKMDVFWVMILYSLVVVCQHFREWLCFHQAGWVCHIQKRRANVLTHSDLWVRNLYKDCGRSKHTQNIWKEDCEENIWTHTRKRMLKNKDKQKDKGPITGGRYCKIYKILRSLLVWGMYGHVRKILPSLQFEP